MQTPNEFNVWSSDIDFYNGRTFISQIKKHTEQRIRQGNLSNGSSKHSIVINQFIREEQLMKYLTMKYHRMIKIAIIKACDKGLREKYISLNKKDFKANYPGLGTPESCANRWMINHMTNPKSELLPYQGKNYYGLPVLKDHFEGIKYDIWTSTKNDITIKLSW